MARTGQLAHNPNLKSQVTNWPTIGGNVGYGRSVDQVADPFEASPRHRENIANTQFTHAGVGVVEIRAPLGDRGLQAAPHGLADGGCARGAEAGSRALRLLGCVLYVMRKPLFARRSLATV